ncbi:protein of unknown function [Shewanella benthica]|uniref:Uncharacterized protein n=1 Tax=Shewanella benthica TaxID=43661 RepID=A0A330M8N5_9GAMM|nr:hypothetical protein [Shewanella benthica]SQH78462.1 protein of unknown function [Shewanella benthica]
MFLTLVGENDATVNVTFNWIKDGTPALTPSYNLAKLLEQYRSKSDDMTHSLALGEVSSKFSDSPEALKELILKCGITPDYQDQLTP